MSEELDLEALRRREVQMMGAAISTRSWHDMENAYNQLRDKIDAELIRPKQAGQLEGDERGAIIAMLRRAVCEAVAGSSKPSFMCGTPAKANSVLSFAFAKIAEAIENGEHLRTPDTQAQGEEN